jgi:hypothetical protein
MIRNKILIAIDLKPLQGLKQEKSIKKHPRRRVLFGCLLDNRGLLAGWRRLARVQLLYRIGEVLDLT